MKLLSCGALLLFAASMVAQQQGNPPYSPPPYGTPPTFPQEQKPAQPMPPDTKAPPPETLPSADVEQQIQKKLATEPLLAKTNLNASVDDKSVVLSGTVADERQHELALRIAESYSGDRRIVDKIQVRKRT
jgi:BON domain